MIGIPGKRLLMLGGADIQVTAIQAAKELGLYVITCDNRPRNPGHRYADEYHEVSTTDLDAVLALAKQLRIDGVSAYASDPAANTAAYVAEKLGLPGDPYQAVQAIQDKIQFRNLQDHLGMPAPRALRATSGSMISKHAAKWPYGGILKPVDSSGSKGVHRVRPGVSVRKAALLFSDAENFSRAGKVILEEFIPRKGKQMTGDILVIEGRISAWCFGDVHFNDRVNGLVPRGVTIPGSIPELKVNSAIRDLQRLIDHVGLRQGVYNVDLYLDRADRPIIVDLGLRNGGNMLNTLYQKKIGLDLMRISLQLCMGQKPASAGVMDHKDVFVGHCVVHSLTTGKLMSIEFSEQLLSRTFYRSINVEPGDEVHCFMNSGHRIGLLLLQFPEKNEMLEVYSDIYSHMKVVVEPIER